MAAWRCTSCAIDWPYMGQFSGECKVCGAQVWTHHEGVPVGVDEAQRLWASARLDRKAEKARRARVAEFELMYADREVAKLMASIDAEWAGITAPPQDADA